MLRTHLCDLQYLRRPSILDLFNFTLAYWTAVTDTDGKHEDKLIVGRNEIVLQRKRYPFRPTPAREPGRFSRDIAPLTDVLFM